MKPWLWIPPHLAHDWAPKAISFSSHFFPAQPPHWNSFTWNQIQFPNRIGIAGGVDKNGECLKAWYKLGCGFTEIGTITPLPQKPNPGKIIDRNVAQKVLWNKMGFPSLGADFVLSQLQKNISFKQGPLFINIGKNRDTSLEKAHEDYLVLIQKFKSLADAFVVNISSPNTVGLRQLLSKEYLKSFISPIVQKAQNIPVLVKLSPDMSEEDFYNSLEVCVSEGVRGFVLTNTTTDRSFVPELPKEGGVSGLLLKEKSILALRRAHEYLSQNRQNYLLISVGGIFSPEDVFERLHFGADLAQIYTGLIFNGPGIFRRIAGAASEREINKS